MQVGVEGGQGFAARLRRRTARLQDLAGARLDVPQADGARGVQEFGVLERGHHGEQGVQPGLGLRGAGRSCGGERVQRPPRVRESGPRLAARPRGAVPRRDR
nr:hypothetical protein [Kutzneria buriramensis]WKX10665.1 hypothetical protein Q4V64_25465 [Kutzneria buriramensis]